jgi:hypothetical protein
MVASDTNLLTLLVAAQRTTARAHPNPRYKMPMKPAIPMGCEVENLCVTWDDAWPMPMIHPNNVIATPNTTHHFQYHDYSTVPPHLKQRR